MCSYSTGDSKQGLICIYVHMYCCRMCSLTIECVLIQQVTATRGELSEDARAALQAQVQMLQALILKSAVCSDFI